MSSIIADLCTNLISSQVEAEMARQTTKQKKIQNNQNNTQAEKIQTSPGYNRQYLRTARVLLQSSVMSDMLLNVSDVAVYITATCVKRCINVIDWTDF